MKKKNRKKNHKFDAKRNLSCSVSVPLFKTADSLLDPMGSLCWTVEGAARTGGSAPDDICRKSATLGGTVARMAPCCGAEPGACGEGLTAGWIDAKDSPDDGCCLMASEVSWGSEGWEAERWRTSLLRLLWTSFLCGDACCGCDDCCCCCCVVTADSWGTSDSCEAVGDPYWKVRPAVNEQGDMTPPGVGCCKGVAGFPGDEKATLPARRAAGMMDAEVL